MQRLLGKEDEDERKNNNKTTIDLTPNVYHISYIHDLLSSCKVHKTQTPQFPKGGSDTQED